MSKLQKRWIIYRLENAQVLLLTSYGRLGWPNSCCQQRAWARNTDHGPDNPTVNLNSSSGSSTSDKEDARHMAAVMNAIVSFRQRMPSRRQALAAKV